jgi:predicted dithiol-disulfide oxidoreductase (DUF899 family)
MLTEAGSTERKIVSAEEWLAARKRLLEKEKELTRLHDQLSDARRELPWVKVEKTYVFEGPEGEQTLADLFQGRSQLIVYHFMYGPEWAEGCAGCSFLIDHVGGALPHLSARDVAFVAVSRATVTQIEAFKKRMGWTLPWVSSNRCDFNWDFHVSFTQEQLHKGVVPYNFKIQKYPDEWPSDEAPGMSVFYRDAEGSIYHTYSTFGRGGEIALGTYQLLDIVPKGRDEAGLPFPMAWVRHHDRYGDPSANPWQHPQESHDSACCH